MAIWERRRADTLAAALHAYRRKHPHKDFIHQRLGAIQVVVAQAARTTETTADELDAHRAQVCDVCRGFTLYACDVPSGWSAQCALVSNNVSAFGAI